MKDRILFVTFLLFVNTGWLPAQDAVEILTQSAQLFGAGMYSETVELIEKNKPSLEKSPYYTSVLTILGVAYTSMGNYPKAETTCLEEKAIHEKTLGKEHQSYANSLVNLGYIYRQMGDYAKAETCYLEVKAIQEKMSGREHPGYANSISSLAALYNEMGEYTRAVTFYLEAKTIQEKVSGKENLDYASTVNNLAAAYCNTGDYTKAEIHYREALNNLEKVLGKQNANYAFSLGNLGTVYRKIGNNNMAEIYCREAQDILGKVLGKEHPAYAIATNNLGNLYTETGDFAKAETCFTEVKTIWEKGFGREHPNHVTSLNDLGSMYLLTKNFTKAETVKTEADKIVTGKIEKDFTILSERQRSLFWDMNKHHFELSYSYAHVHPENSMITHVYDNTLFNKGLLLRTANGIRDAVYSSGNTVLIKQYEELRSVRQMINSLQTKELPDLQTIEKLENRSDSLDKILTIASGVYKDIRKDISMKWQDVRNTLQTGEAAVEFVHFRLYGKKGFTDSTIYCALLLKKEATSPVWIQLCNERQLQTLTQREKGIPDDRFTQQLYSGEKGDHLYRLIWKPLEKELQDVRTVFYSPSGMLHQIAFAAIPVDGGRDAARHVSTSVLSDKYDLRLVSSTREIARLKKEKTGSLPHGMAAVYGGLYYDAATSPTLILPQGDGKPPVISAAPQKNVSLPLGEGQGGAFGLWGRGGASWMFLEGTETEAEQICEYLNERKIPNRLYSEAAGNEESFKRLSGTATGIIHLATHGFFLEDIEEENSRDVVRRLSGGTRKAFENPLLRSGLLLAGGNRAWTGEEVSAGVEDGILTADEIAQMNLIKTQLVVLSACETGLGELRSAEGVFGLQRAFKLAGVETLVMSLWSVPDDATAELMTGFYKLWLSGKSKCEAFVEAQKQVREEYKETFYWAGFVMMD